MAAGADAEYCSRMLRSSALGWKTHAWWTRLRKQRRTNSTSTAAVVVDEDEEEEEEATFLRAASSTRRGCSTLAHTGSNVLYCLASP